MKKLLLAIGLPLSIVSCYAQHTKYLFVEPNVSILYDTTLFRKGEVFVNSAYETEGHEFFYKKEPANKIRLYIKAGRLKKNIDLQTQDSMMKLSKEKLGELNEFAEKNGVKMVVISNVPERVHGFSCSGFVQQKEGTTLTSSMLKAMKSFDGGYCEVSLTSKNEKDLAFDYGILRKFLSGFNYYLPEQMRREDSIIRSSYTVLVDSMPAKKNALGVLQLRARVYTKEKLQHAIWMALVPDLGYSMFEPSPKGDVMVEYLQKYQSDREAYLVVFNSFGKKVKLPFKLPNK